MILHEPQTDAERWSRFSRPAGIGLLLVLVTLGVYWPVVHCGFLSLDDPYYYATNPHVLSGLKGTNVVWAFTTGDVSNWHPLTWLSLMLDAQLFGPGPAGPHFTNLLFHLANTLLLFLLLRRLMSFRPGENIKVPATPAAATRRSALIAALFALHPLHVESVAWVAERKDVLSAFFGLLSLWAYMRYVQKQPGVGPSSFCSATPGSRESSARVVPVLDSRHWTLDYSLALLFFMLGLMSKPMLVTLPMVMLLLDWWPLGRMTGGRWQVTKFGIPVPQFSTLNPQLSILFREKWPFFLLSAISCVVTFIVQQKSGAVGTLTVLSVSERINNVFVSYARYLGKTIWPMTLAIPYPHPGHWPFWPVLGAVLLFAAFCAAAFRWGREFPFMLVGWFWFVVMLVPVIGLVQVGDQAMADRYMYLPLTGIFIILVWGAGEMGARWRVPGAVTGFLAAILLVGCAWRTRVQVGYWHDSGTLFGHARTVAGNDYVACNNLGFWMSRHGAFPEAVECFQESLRIKPSNVDALFNLGNAMSHFGRWDEAVDYYLRVLQITPNQAEVLNNLGMALSARKQYAGAIDSFEQALKVNPDSVSAHNNLATVLFIQHRYDEAVGQYREAVRLMPGNPHLYANLGDALVKQGQTAEAVKWYQEALRLDPEDLQTKAKLQSLGQAF
ncbi:MAG: tetratricopeptide repeat protein [Verrucomicrobiia bacterium]